MKIEMLEKSLENAYRLLLDPDVYMLSIKWHTTKGIKTPTIYTKLLSNMKFSEIQELLENEDTLLVRLVKEA